MKQPRKDLVILVVLFLILITGCSRQNKEQVAMGRYMEEGVRFSDSIDCIYGGMYLNEDKQLVIVGMQDSVLKKTKEADGSYTTEEISWLNDIFGTYEVRDILYTPGKDGNEYAVLSINDGNDTKSHLFRYNQDGKTEEIKISEFEEYSMFGKYRNYWQANVIYVDDAGSILIGFHSQTVLYDKDGNVIYEIQNVYGASQAVYENKVYLLNDDSDHVIEYDFQTGNEQTRIQVKNDGYNGADNSNIKMFTGLDGTLYLLNYAGVHKLSEGGNLWETIIDGTLNSLCSSDNEINRVCVDGEGQFYVLIRDIDYNNVLLSYHYDKDVPAVPTKELTIYSLYRKKSIVQAIVAYQKQHKDIRVDYRVAISDQDEYDSTVNIADYIRVLNTQLLSGNGEDILVLDHMDIDALIKKGILEDITEIINPMMEEQQLYPAVAKTYQEDDVIYAVPIRMKVPVVFGTKEALESANTLKELANYAKENKEKEFLGKVLYTYIVDQLYNEYCVELYEKDGTITKEKVQEFLTNLKTIAEHPDCTDETSDDEISGAMALREKVASFGIEEATDPSTFILGFQLQDQGICQWMQLKNEFTPSISIGINRASKHKEEAGEFLQLLLSEEMQSSYIDEGITVNPQCALSMLQGEEGEHYMTYGYGFRGELFLVEVMYPNEVQKKEYQSMLSRLQKPVVVNETIKAKVLEVATRCMEESISIESATEELMTFLSTYMEE